jgi:hypothetical protein
MSRWFTLSVGLLAACADGGGDPEPGEVGPRAFVSAEAEAYVGVAANDTSLSVYVCDGTPESEGAVHLWFEGAITDEAFDLVHASGATATGTFDGAEGVTGTVTTQEGVELAIDGAPVPVDAEDQGLFRGEGTDAEGEVLLAGWVVVSETDQRGSLLFGGTGGLQVVSRLPPGATTFDAIVDGTSNTLTVENRMNRFR